MIRTAKALDISHRHAPNSVWLLQQHLEACLCTLFELIQYALLPQSAHYSSAALLCPASSRVDLSSVRQRVFAHMRAEWELILQCEGHASSQAILHQHCPYVKWQAFREIQTEAEWSSYTLSAELTELLRAWHPTIQSSSNVEDLFNEIQDCVKRAGKADVGSICNMAAVSIRGCHRKVEATEGATGVTLRSEDFEGNDIRSLKSNIFRPDACPASSVASQVAVVILFYFVCKPVDCLVPVASVLPLSAYTCCS